MLVLSCSPSPTASPSPAASSAQSPSIGEVATPTPTPAIPTSEDLIAAALAAGSITYEQSLLDRALALFDSPGLPKEFHSDVPNLDAAGDLFGEIDSKQSTLSASLLAQLAPYRVRPSDPTSIFNNPPARARVGGGIAAVAVQMPPADAGPNWQSLPAVGGLVRVWVNSSADAGTELAQHAADVAMVWAAYPGIFTYPMPDTPKIPSAAVNPDGAIDFYFVNASDLDPRRTDCGKTPKPAFCVFGTSYAGFAQRADPRVGHTASGYLVVDAASSGDELVDTIAHELAHASQYAYDEGESSWLKESTSTWVAYRVMKKLGRTPQFAYNRLPQLFAGLDKKLTRTDNYNAYSSWLYLQFAAMVKKDVVVTDIWKAAAADGVQGEKAVDSVFPFANNFADFAVRDWNQDPVVPLYKTADSTFPADQPNIRNSVKTLAGGKEDALNVSLPLLASAYYDYTFTDTTQDVTFANSLAKVANAHVWAIKQVKGVWQKPEDWTTQAKPVFCRDVATEDLGRVILIVSNSSLTAPLNAPQPPKVIAGTKGCSGWTGTMTGTSVWHLGDQHGTATATFSGTWVAVPDDQPIDPCQSPLPDGCIAYVPHGTISWTWDAHSSLCNETRSGATAAGQTGGAGTLPPNAQIFALQPDGNGHYGYWGHTAWDPGQKMKCPDLHSGTGPPSYFDLSADSSGTGAGDGTGDTCNFTTWQIDVKAKTISGSCDDWKNAGSSMSMQWNLTRVDPAPGG